MRNQSVHTSGGKVIPCKCAHWQCLPIQELQCIHLPFLPHLLRFRKKLSAQPMPSPPGLPDYADYSTSGNYAYSPSFLNCSSRTGISRCSCISVCAKSRALQALPGKPDFLKTILLFNTSQCFINSNRVCANPFYLASALFPSNRRNTETQRHNRIYLCPEPRALCYLFAMLHDLCSMPFFALFTFTPHSLICRHVSMLFNF